MECYNQANSIVLLLKYHNNSYKCGYTMRLIASGRETKSHCLFTHIKLNIFFPSFFSFYTMQPNLFQSHFSVYQFIFEHFLPLLYLRCCFFFNSSAQVLLSTLFGFVMFCNMRLCTVHAPVLFGWFKVWLNLLTIGFNTYIDYIALYFM